MVKIIIEWQLEQTEAKAIKSQYDRWSVRTLAKTVICEEQQEQVLELSPSQIEKKIVKLRRGFKFDVVHVRMYGTEQNGSGCAAQHHAQPGNLIEQEQK